MARITTRGSTESSTRSSSSGLARAGASGLSEGRASARAFASRDVFGDGLGGQQRLVDARRRDTDAAIGDGVLGHLVEPARQPLRGRREWKHRQLDAARALVARTAERICQHRLRRAEVSERLAARLYQRAAKLRQELAILRVALFAERERVVE